MSGLDHIVSDVNTQGKYLCNYLYMKKRISYDDYIFLYKELDWDEEGRNQAYMYLLRKLLRKQSLDNLFEYSYDQFINAKLKIYRNVSSLGASYLDVIERELQDKMNA